MQERRGPAMRYAAFAAAGAIVVSSAAIALQYRDRGRPAETGPGQRLAARLANARGGETITLPPGDYGTIEFPARSWSPAIRIVARAARFTGLTLRQVDGVTISGGTVIGTNGRSYGVSLSNVRNVTLEGMTITGAHRGIVLGRSDRVTISGNTLVGLLSDGIDIANVTNVIVRNNTCRDFSPTPATFDAAGKRLTVGDHPDCIQAWSRPPTPTADVLVENNDMDGRMQGVFFGNHVRGGVDDGGFDRIVIRNNRIRVDHPNGIMLKDARDSIVSGNTVSSIPGVRNTRSGSAVRTWISVKGGTNNRVCGNTVADFPDTPFTRPCR